MAPAVAALAREFRVLTTSLPGEPGSMPFAPGAGFDLFVDQIDAVLDRAGVERAIVCGISFGGLIALRYAARRDGRVRALILVSTPGPRWRPSTSQRLYTRWPVLASPIFVAGAVRRGWRELCALHPTPGHRMRACASAGWRVVNAPARPRRMSRRAWLAERQDFEDDCARVKAPTLVVTGERDLDRVVPSDDTLRYLNLIPGSSFELFEGTGHLGTVLAPERFAAIVSRFSRTL
jgi:pimeloyl-ACP methyl ester carboxylesterase